MFYSDIKKQTKYHNNFVQVYKLKDIINCSKGFYPISGVLAQ